MNRFNRPERRNRNQGTAKRGHGQNNRQVISSRSGDDLRFYDRLESYTRVRRRIQGRWVHFVVEQTRPGYLHSCTVDDLHQMLSNVLFDDLADMDLIVLRQPKHKESSLNGVWGRLLYGFQFEGRSHHAIMIEAITTRDSLKWSKKLSPDDQAELDRLRSAGFRFKEGRRIFEAPITLAAARTLQLYHTLPHELGHYLDYQEKVEAPAQEDRKRLEVVDRATNAPNLDDEHPIWDEWNTLFDRLNEHEDRLWNLYWKRPTSEREVYAHRAAKRMADRLRKLNVIPFERKLDPESLANDGLRWSDFSEEPEPSQD